MRGHDGIETARLVAAVEQVQAWRSEFTAAQTAVMHALDDAVRAGEVTREEAAEIEAVVRRGHVHGARKRLTRARRRHASS